MRAARERGSVLIMVPALVLVLVILGAICVDSAIEYLGHRQLQDFANSVADQVAAASLDQPGFYGGGTVALSPSLVGPIVEQAVQAQNGGGGLRDLQATYTLSPDDRTVTIDATATISDVFGPAVGGQHDVHIGATGSATLHEVEVNG
jgi:hypothetical protein